MNLQYITSSEGYCEWGEKSLMLALREREELPLSRGIPPTLKKQRLALR
jgi:hypothetical protein